jgi:hypothetical protein
MSNQSAIRKVGILTTIFTAVVSAIFAVSAPSAWACACCSEHGERHISVGPIEDYNQDLLSEIAFVPRANLYSTAADWEEAIRGINNPAHSYAYKVSVRQNGTKWIFTLSDGQGNKGKLTLASTNRLRQFAIDTKPEMSTSDSYQPVELYKELGVFGPVSGNGIFAIDKTNPPRGNLTFHGRGNSCHDVSQFTNWTLDVIGPETRFRFFGKLSSGYQPESN